MKQSQGVYNAVHSVFAENDITFEDGMNAGELMTKELRAQVNSIVTQGLENGEIDFSDSAKAKYDTTKKIVGYTAGLLSNWFRKDTRLNGGSKYVPTNPGSRTGSSDPEIKNLKLLVKSGRLSTAQTTVAEARITEKQAFLKAEKAKNVEVDFTAIPADLLDSLGIEV